MIYTIDNDRTLRRTYEGFYVVSIKSKTITTIGFYSEIQRPSCVTTLQHILGGPATWAPQDSTINAYMVCSTTYKISPLKQYASATMKDIPPTYFHFPKKSN